MESHPTPTHDPMAVEATNTTESAAARQEPAPDCCPEVLLNDDDILSSSKLTELQLQMDPSQSVIGRAMKMWGSKK